MAASSTLVKDTERHRDATRHWNVGDGQSLGLSLSPPIAKPDPFLYSTFLFLNLESRVEFRSMEQTEYPCQHAVAARRGIDQDLRKVTAASH